MAHPTFWRYMLRECPEAADSLRRAFEPLHELVWDFEKQKRHREHGRAAFEKQAAKLRRRQERRQNRRRQ